MHDEEMEAYNRIKNAKEKKKIPIDDGTRRSGLFKPKPKVKETPEEREKRFVEKAAKRDSRISARGALNSSNMLYHDDEKFIQQYYRSKFIAKVKAEKGELSIADELIVDLLA